MALNRIYESGKVLPVAVASTVKSGDPVVVGSLSGGVALTDYRASDGKATVDFGGVYDLKVNAVNDSGNVAVAVGDALYYVAGDTIKLSKKSGAGVFFGHALEAITSGQSDTINVRTGSGGSSSAANDGVFMSTEQTGTGSQQTIAHPFGSIPSIVFFVPSEHLSSVNVNIDAGTHTSSNILVTASNGLKFFAVAFR